MRVKGALSFIGGGRGLKLGVQRVDPQGVLQTAVRFSGASVRPKMETRRRRSETREERRDAKGRGGGEANKG